MVVKRAPGGRGRVLERSGAHLAGEETEDGRGIWCQVPSAVAARRGHDWVSWSLVPRPLRRTGVVSPAVLPPPAVALWAKPLSPASHSSLVEWGK